MLPKYTDYFHEEVSVLNISVSNGVATVTTTKPHYLETGDAVVITNYTLHNPITTVSGYNGSTIDYLVTTSVEHDLTRASYETKTVEFGGFTDDSWNDSVTLLQAGRNNFIVRFENGATTPVLNGNEYLKEERIDGTNGHYSITVVNSNTFTIANDALINGTYSDGKITSYVRVGVAYDVEHAVDLYTEQENGDYWAFVIMGTPTASRDNSTITEATTDLLIGSSMEINMIDGFSVLVLIPTSDNKSAGTAIDIARFDLQPIIHKCLLGVSFDSGMSTMAMFKTSFLGCEAALYNDAFLGYIYNYEFQYLLTDDDAVEPTLSRAFRDLNYVEYMGRSEIDEDFTVTSGTPTISGTDYPLQDDIE